MRAQDTHTDGNPGNPYGGGGGGAQAEQGHAPSQAGLGFMYREGQGVPQDDAEAARWYRLAAEQGDRSTYEIFWDLIKNTDLLEEKVRLLSSICQFSDKELLNETLDRALSPSVRSQDAVIIIVSVAGNKIG